MLDADGTRAALTGAGKSRWAEMAGAAHDAIAGKIDERKQRHLAAVLDRFEAELAPVLAAFHAEHADDPELPDEARELIRTITTPEHFTESLLIGVAVGATVYPIIGAMTAPTAQLVASQVWAKQPTMPLTPTELASAVLKGVLTEAAAADGALQSGLNGTRFAQLVEVAGQSIGLAEALLLYRRDQINLDRLTDVMRYSNLNPKFYDLVPMLRYTPPGAGTVITGALKGHLDDATAAKKIGESGTNPDNYEWLKASAGRPPGVMQLLELLNRGEIDEARVAQGVRQSDINDDYLSEVLALRWYVPPPRSVVPQLRHGSITEARAHELLTQRGVRPEDQDAFIAEAHTSRTTTERTLTVAQVITAYDERLISRADAQARIVALHYTAADAAMLLGEADERAKDRALRGALTLNHSLFVRYRATRAETQTQLAALGIPAGDITALLDGWAHERRANEPDLTVAQWQGLLRRGSITHARFADEMSAYGYDAAHTDFLAELAFPPPKAPAAAKSKDLSVSQLVKLYEAGEVPAAELRSRLIQLGYSAAEADEIISLATPPAPTT